jgi:hypothetical protein
MSQKRKSRNYWNIDRIKRDVRVIIQQIGHFPTAKEFIKQEIISEEVNDMVIKKEFIVVVSGTSPRYPTSFLGQSNGDTMLSFCEFATEDEAIEYIETINNNMSDYQIFRKHKDVKMGRPH